MTKKDLICRVAEILRDNGIRKPVTSPKHVFHISDDEGNSKDFIVKKTDKTVIYTANDVTAILDACLSVVSDAIRRGEDVSIHGFGTLGVHKRAARRARHPITGEAVDVHERYVPKFVFGNKLRVAAKLYELSLDDFESEADCMDIDDGVDEEVYGGD